jgi:hypothetical protein
MSTTSFPSSGEYDELAIPATPPPGDLDDCYIPTPHIAGLIMNGEPVVDSDSNMDDDNTPIASHNDEDLLSKQGESGKTPKSQDSRVRS